MKICIIGGAGYVGTTLVPNLLAGGHSITVLDTFWYGDYLPNSNSSLKKIKGDMRLKANLRSAIKGHDAVIHLACVSNDPSFDMNPKLGKSINYDAFISLCKILKEESIPRFIYASSSSVYGVSEALEVFESNPKNPLTDYSKYKLACETYLQSFGTGGSWTILRPATVCGYSPRLRLDLVVNILTMQAIINQKITLFGRIQKRPNIHVQDMAAAYEFILNKDYKYIDQKIFNVGFENLTLLQIANTVKSVFKDPDIEIVEEPTNDPRSYHINSDKILEAGFKPRYSVRRAIQSLKKAYEAGEIENPFGKTKYSNIKRMKELNLT